MTANKKGTYMQWSNGITETPPDGAVAQELFHSVVNDRLEYPKCDLSNCLRTNLWLEKYVQYKMLMRFQEKDEKEEKEEDVGLSIVRNNKKERLWVCSYQSHMV